MIAENSIQITNVIDLSVAYLTRFFSKSGEIQKIQKDQLNKIVLIEFKNKKAVEKTFVFNGRVLDKKPILIKRLNQIRQVKQKQNGFKEKDKISSQKLHLLKLPSFHELNKKDIKLQKQSSYKQILKGEEKQDFVILLNNNPFENIKSKAQLWKTIINEMKKTLQTKESGKIEIIMSISFCIWGFIQLKLQQIEFLMKHKQNMKSKYVENFIQEIVANKLNMLKNINLITNASRFKVLEQKEGLVFGFNVNYPQQTEQEAQFFCQTNDAVHKFLILIYQQSHLLGKICHILHTNSLIIYEDQSFLQNILKTFLYKPSLELNQSKEDNSTYKGQENLKESEKMQNEDKSQSLNSFTGEIEHYGSCLFQKLTHQLSNSLIWIERISTKIQTLQDFPKLFTSSYIFQQPKGRTLSQSSFFNIYKIHEQQNQLKKIQCYTFSDYVLVFEEGQFSLQELVQNSLNFIRFKLRKLLAKHQQQKQCKIEQYIFCDKYQSSMMNEQQKQEINSKKILNQDQKIRLSLELDIFSVGIQILQKKLQILNSWKTIENCCQKLLETFHNQDSLNKFQLSINHNFVLIQMIPQKKGEFNSFKCENYLINHIDSHIIGKNTIIASEQFAEKVAEKVLQNTEKNELFGFKDKIYLGSQIWRLYNKSGARRAKLKISQYHFKKLKSE